MIIKTGAFGVDYSQGHLPVQLLSDRGITFAGLYLKYAGYWGGYSASLMDNGIGIMPLAENYAGDALGGVNLANVNGPKFCKLARGYGVTEGTPLVFAHDVAAYTPQVALYFQRLALICHDAGYKLGGYVTKRVVDDVHRLGTVFDLIVVPSGYMMNGDHVRSDEAHVWQQLSNWQTVPGFNVDPLLAMRPFTCWGNPTPFSTTQLGTDTMKFVYNSDNPTDPSRYMTNGFVYRHVTMDDATAFADQCTNTVATSAPLTTVEFYAMVDVTK